MRLGVLLLFSAVVTFAYLTGCSSMPASEGPKLTGKAATKYAAVVYAQPQAFTPVRPITFAVSSDEIGVVRRLSASHTQDVRGPITAGQ